MTTTGIIIILIAAVLLLALGASAIRIVREYQRVVVFTVGRLRRERGPGLVLVNPLIERTQSVNLQVDTADIPLANQHAINEQLKEIIDEATEPWGVQVVGVETKDVALPDTMKRAMDRQAEAERERRANVIAAEGEFQVAARLAEAAHVISAERGALTLRTLQTLAEVATEHNSTLVLPIPLDLMDVVRDRRPVTAASVHMVNGTD